MRHNDHDPSYAPADIPGLAPPNRRASGSARSVRSPHLRCFHDGDHESAGTLEQLGIWLGDDDDERRGVNGFSQKQVEKQYFDATEGGKHCNSAEPFVFDHNPGCITQLVECVVCKARFTLENIAFEWTNDDDPEVDNRTTMSKNVSLVKAWTSTSVENRTDTALGMDFGVQTAPRRQRA